MARASATILAHFEAHLTDTLDRLQRDHLPAYARLVGKILASQEKRVFAELTELSDYEFDLPEAPPPPRSQPAKPARGAPYLAQQQPALSPLEAVEEILGRHRSTVKSVFSNRRSGAASPRD